MASPQMPLRTCVGCDARRPKANLIRLFREDEVKVGLDPAGKSGGRGAYLCRDASCFESALKRRSLERSLKGTLTPEVQEELLQHLSQVLAGDDRIFRLGDELPIQS